MTEVTKSLFDQVAVVTGASSGVGRAIAKALAVEGTRLCLVGRSRSALRKAFPSGCVVETDLTVDEDVRRFGEVVQREFHRVDILIHSAGLFSMATSDSALVSDLDAQYNLNVRAPYVLTQMLLPMIAARQGQIVFINSSVGLTSRAGVGQYAATKHALKAIADSLRDEVNPLGVRVLSVFLGRTATPMQERVHELEGKNYDPDRLLQPEDVASVVVHALGLPRSAEVTELTIRPAAK